MLRRWGLANSVLVESGGNYISPKNPQQRQKRGGVQRPYPSQLHATVLDGAEVISFSGKNAVVLSDSPGHRAPFLVIPLVSPQRSTSASSPTVHSPNPGGLLQLAVHSSRSSYSFAHLAKTCWLLMACDALCQVVGLL